jgi:hypothetical protein
MKKRTAALLALSVGILNPGLANAFGTQSSSTDPVPTEAKDVLEGTPLLDSLLNLQESAADVSQSVAPALAVSVLPQAVLANLSEGFDSVSSLASRGWILQNNSNPPPVDPTIAWAQGSTEQSGLRGQAGGNNSFIQSDVSVTAGDANGENGVVSNWLITPELDFTNGGVVSFFARTIGVQTKAEFLEVRQSIAGTSTGFGAALSGTDLGNFKTLVGSAGELENPAVDGNPTSIPFGRWRQYTFNVAAGTSGRLAFRYFATNGGLNGSQALYLGVDTVEYAAAIPEPVSSSFAGFAVLGLTSYLKSKRKRQIG